MTRNTQRRHEGRMLATNRRMPVQDFLLVAFSVAVIVLSTWPEAPPRQRVQLRSPDGTLREYSLRENDPDLAKLKLALEKWAKAGQETRLAVARWRTQVADFYLARTEALQGESSGPFHPASYSGGELQSRQLSMREGKGQHLERQYWQTFGQAARQEIASVEEIRRSRKALEVPPPIVFGRVEPGPKPVFAALISPLVGLLVALGFAGWAYLFPALRLAVPEAEETVGRPNLAVSSGGSGTSHELRLVVPSAWVRIHQPAGVRARQLATLAISLGAVVSILV